MQINILCNFGIIIRRPPKTFVFNFLLIFKLKTEFTHILIQKIDLSKILLLYKMLLNVFRFFFFLFLF